ncbi:MAG: 4Fe-4S ferredoxin [Ruminococcaceae bacterium]|nr:4Fe-4S ferredoxin [Oscillospiraceae bacterium]
MTIFYFTSTGNCLAVAKKIGGNLVSIPQVIDSPDLHFKDDVIGLIFPIYGLGIPKMVRKFLEKATWEAGYSFAIGTYGNLPGAAMTDVQNFAKKRGQCFDYAESLLMVDNFLPNFDMNDQIAKLPEKRIEENFSRIIADILNRKILKATAGWGWRAATVVIRNGENLFINGKQGQRYMINQDCIKCGICAKICPAGNITVSDQVKFGDRCEGCLGCVHLCPKNAIHMKNEKSITRWRNPDVSLNEMITANNRQKG